MTEQTEKLRRARLAAAWVGVFIPLALTLIGSIIIAIATPRLPGEIAIQFSFSGAPTNYGPPFLMLVVALAIGLLLSLISIFVIGQPTQEGQIWSRNHRFIPALMLGSVAMLEFMAVGTVLLQVDLADARDIANPSVMLVTGLLAWPVLTVIGYLVQPKFTVQLTAAASGSTTATQKPQVHGTRTVWVGSTALPPVARIVIAAILTAAIGVALALLLLGNPYWVAAGLVALSFAVAAAIGTEYHIRIDRNGLTARTPIGWPVFRLPAADIETVTVGNIQPLGEFGGWGVRSNLDGFGLTLRAGPGLRVKRRNGRMFIITLNDAETAAAVLTAAAESSAE